MTIPSTSSALLRSRPGIQQAARPARRPSLPWHSLQEMRASSPAEMLFGPEHLGLDPDDLSAEGDARLLNSHLGLLDPFPVAPEGAVPLVPNRLRHDEGMFTWSYIAFPQHLIGQILLLSLPHSPLIGFMRTGRFAGSTLSPTMMWPTSPLNQRYCGTAFFARRNSPFMPS